jgi:hypothetical protein
VTQRDVAIALGRDKPLSGGLISSWETGSAVPTEERLREIALLFSTPRSLDGRPHLLPEQELTPDEAADRDRLTELLMRLRGDVVTDDASPSEDTSRAFWCFGDDQPVCIVGSRLPDSALRGVPYANPAHPNYMPLLRHADGHTVMEIFGQVRMENPDSRVTYRVDGDPEVPSELGGHVIVVGGGDFNSQAAWFGERMSLPIAAAGGEPGDPDPGGAFTVTITVDGTETEKRFTPVYEGEVRTTVSELVDGRVVQREAVWPRLTYDVGLLARQPNPLNLHATATLCSGLSALGTYGVARTFTARRLRERNEEYRSKRFGDAEAYWMLLLVAVNQGQAMPPDLEREYQRLAEWAEGE